MVKRAVIKKRSRKTPRKRSQASKKVQNRFKNRSKKIRNLPPHLQSLVGTPLISNKVQTEVMKQDMNSSVTGLNLEEVLNITSKNDGANHLNQSFIVLDDTILDKSTVSVNNLEESCFIIDVEGSPLTESKSLFQSSSKTVKDDNDGNLARSPDENGAVILIEEKPPPKILDNEKSSKNSNEFKDDNRTTFSNCEKTDIENFKNDDLKLNSGDVPSDLQHKSMSNNVRDQSKNCQHDNLLYNKGTLIHNQFWYNKQFDSTPQEKKQNWSSIKKNGAMKKLEKTPSQNLVLKNISNNNYADLSDKPCIFVDDESDSDVEVVAVFNPQDRLIELSDSEDSVIIEEISPPLTIPLPKGKNAKRKRANKIINSSKKNERTPNSKKKKKKLDLSKEPAKADLRPIVIDGCNVGMGHSKSKMLSVAGLKICYDYFCNRGHIVKIFLPQSRKYSPMTTDSALLDKMEREGTVIFTPGRRVDGKLIGSYDDRFILEYASLKGAIVVTRDNYRDLYSEREEFKDTIKNRLLQYTFVDDLIMFPQDPLGRDGPNLDKFLQFPANNDSPSTSKS